MANKTPKIRWNEKWDSCFLKGYFENIIFTLYDASSIGDDRVTWRMTIGEKGEDIQKGTCPKGDWVYINDKEGTEEDTGFATSSYWKELNKQPKTQAKKECRLALIEYLKKEDNQ